MDKPQKKEEQEENNNNNNNNNSKTTTEMIKGKLQIEVLDDFIGNLNSEHLQLKRTPYEPSVEYFMEQIFYGM